MKGNKKIIFIISAGHSGSTLLTKLLGQQNGIFGGSELVNYSNDSVRSEISYCSCKVPYKNCKFWSEIAKKNDIDNLQLFSILKKSKLPYLKLLVTIFFNWKFSSKIINKNISAYHALYRSIFQLDNSEIIVDASKSFFNALILASQMEYESNFIFLKRDGRAVLNSYLKSHYYVDIDGVKTKNKRVNFDDKGVVEYWVKQNILGLILKFVRYRKTTTIKYENLINDTDNQLDKLSNAIDVDFDHNILKFSEEDHLFEGNSSRMNTKKIKRIDLEKWRSGLSVEQLRKFDWKARTLNFLLGY